MLRLLLGRLAPAGLDLNLYVRPSPTPKQIPPTTVLCYYGVGKPTERAYIYKTAGDDGAIDVIDAAINDPRRNVSDGVLMGEGDGTVSLLSLGYHCAKASKV